MKKTFVKVMLLVLALIIIVSNTNVVSAKNILDRDSDVSTTKEIPDKDSVIDSKYNPQICFDRDDFETDEEYEQYVRATGDTSGMIQNDVRNDRGEKKTVVSKKAADHGKTATLRYTITGLTCKNAIQKTYIGTSYIYVLQRAGKDMYLSRCVISGKKATYKDRMTLVEFGHSQTLEWFEYDGKPYFWIACNSSSDTDQYWSTQIGRLEYEKNTTVKYTDIKRLSAIIKANKTGTANGSIKRADAALSSDKSILLVWSRNTQNVMQFAFYRASDVNAAITESNSKYVRCDSDAIKKACISSFTTKNNFLEGGSCQGLEVSDEKSIYIASGLYDQKTRKSNTKWIYKTNSTGTLTQSAYIKNPGLAAGTNTEIQGIQLKGDDVYFGLCNHDDKLKGTQYIYSIAKSAMVSV